MLINVKYIMGSDLIKKHKITVGNKKYPLSIERSKTRKKSYTGLYDAKDKKFIIKVPYFFTDNDSLESFNMLFRNTNLTEYIQEREIYYKQELQKESRFSFKQGSTFLFKGVEYSLTINVNEELSKPEIKLIEDKIMITVKRKEENSEDNIKKIIKKWYKKNARPYFKERIKEHFYIIEDHSKYNFKFEDLKFRLQDNKSTWGSVNYKIPSINLTWQFIMLPEKMLDYIIIHELTHYASPRKRNNMHSIKFEKNMDKFLPEHKEIEKEILDRYTYVFQF